MTNTGKKSSGYLTEFTGKYDSLANRADAMQLHHHAAFAAAALANLQDNEGMVDYGLLKDGRKRQVMTESMVNYLIPQMQLYFGVNPAALGSGKLGWLKSEQLLGEFTGGLTAGSIKSLFDTQQEALTIDKLAEVSSGIKQDFVKRWLPSTYAHIPDTVDARATVLNEIGLRGKLDPKVARLDELVSLMMHYHGSGVVSPKAYEKSLAYIPHGNHGGH